MTAKSGRALTAGSGEVISTRDAVRKRRGGVVKDNGKGQAKRGRDVAGKASTSSATAAGSRGAPDKCQTN